MRIFITGVACIGKTTIGRKLANLLEYQFFDLDYEIENFFGTSMRISSKELLFTTSIRIKFKKASQIAKSVSIYVK